MLLQVVVRRGRLCVAIKAGRQSDLPKGSMTLATSSTGRLPPGTCVCACAALLQHKSQLCRLWQWRSITCGTDAASVTAHDIRMSGSG